MRFGAVRTRPGANTVPPLRRRVRFLGAPCKDTLFFGLCFRNAGSSGAAEAFRFCRAHGQVPYTRKTRVCQGGLMLPSPAVSTRPAVAAAFPVCADFAAFGMIPEFATFVSICIPMRKPPPIRLSKKVHRKLIFSLLLLLAAAVVVSRCMVSSTGGAVSVMPVLPPAEKADGMPSVRGGCLIREDRAPDWSCRLVRAASF